MSKEIPRIQFRVSLSRPIQLKGADRRAIIIAMMAGAYVGFISTVGFGIWIGVPLGVLVWGLLTFLAYRAGKADPFFIDIFIRSLRYKSFYPAHGRFDAFQREYKE